MQGYFCNACCDNNSSLLTVGSHVLLQSRFYANVFWETTFDI